MLIRAAAKNRPLTFGNTRVPPGWDASVIMRGGASALQSAAELQKISPCNCRLSIRSDLRAKGRCRSSLVRAARLPALFLALAQYRRLTDQKKLARDGFRAGFFVGGAHRRAQRPSALRGQWPRNTAPETAAGVLREAPPFSPLGRSSGAPRSAGDGYECDHHPFILGIEIRFHA